MWQVCLVVYVAGMPVCKHALEHGLEQLCGLYGLDSMLYGLDSRQHVPARG
jgi:hypothetical protein